MGSKFWFIPATWAVFLFSMAIVNVANVYTNKAAVAYGFVTQPWFIIIMVVGTIILEFTYLVVEKWLSGVFQ